MIDRRAFLATGGTALAAHVFPSYRPSPWSQATVDTYFAWEELAPGVRLAWGAGTSMVVESAGEALLVDCKGYGLGKTLRREVEAGGNELVAAVNTHHHSAQTGGNYAFTSDVAVIAQRRAGPRIVAGVEGVLRAIAENPQNDLIERRRRDIFDGAHSDAGARRAQADFDELVADVSNIIPANYGPSGTFDDSYTVEVGDLEVELHHFDPAHTDNDTVVWVPALDLMHVGNLVYIDAHPIIDAARGGDTRGWQRCLRRVSELAGPETRIVCSDGGLLGTAHDLATQIEYFEQLHVLVRSALDERMSRDETVGFIPSSGLGRFARMSNPGQLALNLGVVYDELALERREGVAGSPVA